MHWMNHFFAMGIMFRVLGKLFGKDDT